MEIIDQKLLRNTNRIGSHVPSMVVIVFFSVCMALLSHCIWWLEEEKVFNWVINWVIAVPSTPKRNPLRERAMIFVAVINLLMQISFDRNSKFTIIIIIYSFGPGKNYNKLQLKTESFCNNSNSCICNWSFLVMWPASRLT